MNLICPLSTKEFDFMDPHPVAIITGASKGIGKACAVGLANKGYRLVLVARNSQGLLEVANEIKDLNATSAYIHPIIYPLDITNFHRIPVFIEEIINQHGRVDLLINNAGISSEGTLNIEPSEFQHIFNTNLLAPFVLLKEVVPIMKQQGKGYIFNIASRAGKVGFSGKGVYGATKFGMVGLGESLYRELSEHGISVSTICPGWVNTELAQQTGTPLTNEEMIQPEDIMKTIQWLLELSPNACVKEVVLECHKSIA